MDYCGGKPSHNALALHCNPLLSSCTHAAPRGNYKSIKIDHGLLINYFHGRIVGNFNYGAFTSPPLPLLEKTLSGVNNLTRQSEKPSLKGNLDRCKLFRLAWVEGSVSHVIMCTNFRYFS